jgi:hypothetical protein
MEPLPDDLWQVGNEIAGLMQLDVRADFGRRVIGAMHNEVRRERASSQWKFAMGVAAVAFLWLHLSFYVALMTNFHIGDASPSMCGNSSGEQSQTALSYGVHGN